MECWRSLHRFLMFAFSLVLLLAGTAGLVAGVWMKVSPSSMPLGGRWTYGPWESDRTLPCCRVGADGVYRVADSEQPWLSLSYLLMSAGSTLLFLGLVGCCASTASSSSFGRRRLLLFYFAVAAMAVATQAVGVAMAVTLPREQLAKLLGGPAVLELMEENKVLALGLVGGVAALEALAAASSLTLYCMAKRRQG